MATDRMDAYKNTRKNNWQEALRKRCREEMKQRRSLFIDKLRQSGDDYQAPVTDVLRDLIDSSRSAMVAAASCWMGPAAPWGSPSCPGSIAATGDTLSSDSMQSSLSPPWEDDIDSYLQIREDIMNDLMFELYDSCYHGENGITRGAFSVNGVNPAADPWYLASHPEAAQSFDGQVICPLCRAHYLTLEGNLVACSCGLRINTMSDCITMAEIGANIRRGFTEHANSSVEEGKRNSQCPGEPRFWVLHQQPTVQLLCMGCDLCDFLHIVV